MVAEFVQRGNEVEMEFAFIDPIRGSTLVEPADFVQWSNAATFGEGYQAETKANLAPKRPPFKSTAHGASKI
jgi:hypothetical protein